MNKEGKGKGFVRGSGSSRRWLDFVSYTGNFWRGGSTGLPTGLFGCSARMIELQSVLCTRQLHDSKIGGAQPDRNSASHSQGIRAVQERRIDDTLLNSGEITPPGKCSRLDC